MNGRRAALWLGGWGTCLSLLTLPSCGPPPAPPALPLQPDDFALGGIPADVDSTEIRLTFGDPDSIVAADNPFDGGTPLLTWIYDGFEVRFAGESTPVAYMIRSPGESTARGLRVGDPAGTVLRLYGEPAARFEPSWTYVDTSEESWLHVIDLIVRSDTVRRIYIGRALD